MAGITPSRGIALVRIDSGTFAAAAGAAVDLNIVARNQLGPIKDRIRPSQLNGNLRGTIEDIVAYWNTNTTTGMVGEILFWGNDKHNTSNLAQVKLWGQESFIASDWSREGTGATSNLQRLHVGGLSIPYGDLDNTGEFHVTWENNDTAAAGPGNLRFEFGFRPEYGA